MYPIGIWRGAVSAMSSIRIVPIEINQNAIITAQPPAPKNAGGSF